MEIELSNESNFPVTKLDEPALLDVADFAMRSMGLHPESSLAITLVNEPEMSELHVQWMELPGPTDVLSFPMDELVPNNPEPGIVGDLVMCPQFVENQAAENGVSFLSEISLLTIHGILHCLGFDHAEPEQEREMFELQERLLSKWQDERGSK
jgi:probable rRNA maturation factor